MDFFGKGSPQRRSRRLRRVLATGGAAGAAENVSGNAWIRETVSPAEVAHFIHVATAEIKQRGNSLDSYVYDSLLTLFRNISTFFTASIPFERQYVRYKDVHSEHVSAK